MTSDLLNAAYYVHKDSYSDDTHEEARRRLAEQFPGVDGKDIADAYARAGALIEAACDWAEQKRGPNNDGNGIPTRHLERECPGFSASVYGDAQGWGLYLTR